MRRALPNFLPYVALAAIAGGLMSAEAWAAYSGLLIVFLIHPLLDAFFGEASLERQSLAPVPSDLLSSLLLWLYVPLQLALLAWVLSTLGAGPLFGLVWWGKMLSIGALNGAIGITVAHELIHRRRRSERALGVALLASVSYAHFRVEHVFGHHRFVATPLDPGSARRTETLYAFWRRSLPGEWLNAWHIENRRIAAGRGSWRTHRLVHYTVVQLLLAAAVACVFGPAALAFFAGQSLVAILLLEGISYVEHWGLERRELAPGRFEAVQAGHAWDSRHRMTNGFLFNLGRHAHHHLKSNVPYQELQNVESTRVLPFGYSTMLILALFPPLWRRVMEPRLNSAPET